MNFWPFPFPVLFHRFLCVLQFHIGCMNLDGLTNHQGIANKIGIYMEACTSYAYTLDFSQLAVYTLGKALNLLISSSCFLILSSKSTFPPYDSLLDVGFLTTIPAELMFTFALNIVIRATSHHKFHHILAARR